MFILSNQVFIGLGFPYEGPAPLEAIAQGCIFLNAKVMVWSLLKRHYHLIKRLSKIEQMLPVGAYTQGKNFSAKWREK